VGAAKLSGFGVLYHGLDSVGVGSVLAGMVLGAIAVYIIDNKMHHAAAWAFAGAVLSYVGLIHGSQLGWGVSPLISLGYFMFAVTCIVLMRTHPGAAQATAIPVGAAPRGATPVAD
jgi:AGZA family xanthine/uracil permease-like MFS transporter